MHQSTLWILFLPNIDPFVKSCLHRKKAFQSTRRLNNWISGAFQDSDVISDLFKTNLQCILFFSLLAPSFRRSSPPDWTQTSSYIEKIPLNDHRPAGQFKALRGIKTSISYRRFTIWVGSQRDILKKKGRGIHNEGRDTTNACFNRFLSLVSCGRLQLKD